KVAAHLFASLAGLEPKCPILAVPFADPKPYPNHRTLHGGIPGFVEQLSPALKDVRTPLHHVLFIQTPRIIREVRRRDNGNNKTDSEEPYKRPAGVKEEPPGAGQKGSDNPPPGP